MMRTLGQYMLGSSATFGYEVMIEAIRARFADVCQLFHGNRNNYTNRQLAHRYRGFPQVTIATRTTSDHARGSNAEEECRATELMNMEYDTCTKGGEAGKLEVVEKYRRWIYPRTQCMFDGTGSLCEQSCDRYLGNGVHLA